MDKFAETRRISSSLEKTKKKRKLKEPNFLKDTVTKAVFEKIKEINSPKPVAAPKAIYYNKSQAFEIVTDEAPPPVDPLLAIDKKITTKSLGHKPEYRYADRRVLLFRAYQQMHFNPMKRDWMAENRRTIKATNEMRHKRSESSQVDQRINLGANLDVKERLALRTAPQKVAKTMNELYTGA
jgi:hypothetical protein